MHSFEIGAAQPSIARDSGLVCMLARIAVAAVAIESEDGPCAFIAYIFDTVSHF